MSGQYSKFQRLGESLRESLNESKSGGLSLVTFPVTTVLGIKAC